jgi:hypothetical protein
MEGGMNGMVVAGDVLGSNQICVMSFIPICG